MKRWDLVLLAYPFDDWTGAKVRPAVVISSDEYNFRSEDAIFVLITSNTEPRSDFDLLVSDQHPGFAAMGLIKSSMIRVDMIWTLKQALAKRTLGQAGDDIRREIIVRLRRLLPC
jgi:mRNA interferase MazF